ncbi:protein S40-3-like [Miscanthus floridulus]|uniref:protein S40-3-like n=1 Tax=Miscanthus floridulus TaxID=154761 RepID=UPI00345B4BD7
MASAAEELYESEVLWPEAPHGDGDATPSCSSSSRSRAPAPRGVPESERPIHPSSRPVDIPRPAASSAARRRDHEDEDGGWSGSGTVVPPHVLISLRRRSEGAAAFALWSGPGRARELSHLRNSVLRMTGFIEG